MYKTLLIHGMPPKNYRFHGVEEIELLFIRHFKTSFVTEHNFFINPSNRIKNFDFEAIILTSTFLSKLSHPKSYNRLINKYAFIKNKNSIKIGLPQDDYWAQSIKDDWYSKNLDIIVSVFDKKHWPLLYPKSIKNKLLKVKGRYSSEGPISVTTRERVKEKGRKIEELKSIHKIIKKINSKNTIYCSPGHLVGFSPNLKNSEKVKKQLFKHQVKKKFQYSLEWEKDQLAIWDNRSMLHQATPFKGNRIMHRITIL